MTLTAVRSDLATLIASALPNDVGVVDHLPDAVAPPVVFLAWSDPWLKPQTGCTYEAVMEIAAVAQRVEPGGKLETLEAIVNAIVAAIKGSGFVIQTVTAMYPLNIGGVDYLAASVFVLTDVEL